MIAVPIVCSLDGAGFGFVGTHCKELVSAH